MSLEDSHNEFQNSDATFEAFASDLRRSVRPPPSPPGLKARALAAARREMSGEAVSSHSASPLDRWIGAVFNSRLFWAAWATALSLALAVRPPVADVRRAESLPEPPALEASALDRPATWIASTSTRPHPTGPLLSDASSDLPLELN